jgi:hypothetical protein
MKALSFFQRAAVSDGRYDEFFTDTFNENEKAFAVSVDLELQTSP